MPQAGRGPEENIRTWGQLGLGGEWADQPIHTYGYAFTGMANFFQLKVFHGGDKWNPNYRQYVEAGKMVSAGPVGATGSIQHMLREEFAHDKYGIAWTGIPHVANVPEVKPLALAASDAGPFVEPTRSNVQQRTYPLARSVFIQLNRAPGQPLDPKLREFLLYILSRDGQQAVADNGNYLPLTAEAVREQRALLDRAP
jgi:phosphate transport system substrate-binding protein